MARKVRKNSQEYLDYQSEILEHPNYKGLEYGGYWVKPGNSPIGQMRKSWADEKIKELGISGSGIYAKLMYEIHPFKAKPCQTCGKTMSLNYVYPHKNFQKILYKNFSELADKDIALLEVSQIEQLILEENKELFRRVLSERLKGNHEPKALIPELISLLIKQSKERRSNLGPGAMSNFPDRFDGFHSYNLCCRSVEDTGRHASNLKTYTTDRRAYENWSDGNHRAANQLMGHKIFLDTGLSADHLGPVSLGFVHDPHFMVAITTSDNSSKRDRLILKDLKAVIAKEDALKINAASWYCQIIWNKMRDGITTKIITSDRKLEPYYKILQKNKIIFFQILNEILNSKNGEEYLRHTLKTRFKIEHGHDKDYTFETDVQSSNFGNIVSSVERNKTSQSLNEIERFIRVSLESISDFAQKSNRRTSADLNNTELSMLEELKRMLEMDVNPLDIVNQHESIMNHVQLRLLGTVPNQAF